MIAPAGGGIYAIQRKDSDELYIGSAVNIARRWGQHRSALNRGTHHSPRMQSVNDKHGMGVLEFAILEEVADPGQLLAREQVWLDRDGLPAYNSAPVACSALGLKRTPETRALMSAAAKARAPRTSEQRAHHSAMMTGRPQSAETRARISAALMGRARTPEHCAAISGALMGNTRNVGRVGHKHSAETRAAMAAAALTRPPVTDETRAKLSAALKGHKRGIGHVHTPGHRAKISAAMTGLKHSPERIASAVAGRAAAREKKEAA